MKNNAINEKRIHSFLTTLFENDIHAKRILSISNSVLGVIHSGSLVIHLIGYGLAKVKGLCQKHAIKQVDRLFSNSKFDVWEYFYTWVSYIIGSRKEVVIAMDWTEFDADDQSTIALYLITSHGRATPLIWKTVVKSKLKGWRNHHEDTVLIRLYEVLPPNVKVTILADRGFGDQKLYKLLKSLNFDFIIRFREGIMVTNDKGERKIAKNWVPTNGRVRLLRNAKVTSLKTNVPTVACVKKKGMKEPWCLACSSSSMKGAFIVKLYSKRFSIEETFRDQKDIHFGMGLSATHISIPMRRDRLLFISAIAQVFLTLLGAAGESIGMDRRLKANTSKKRTHSLFTQGKHYYESIATLKEEYLKPLIEKFVQLIKEQHVFNEMFGII